MKTEQVYVQRGSTGFHAEVTEVPTQSFQEDFVPTGPGTPVKIHSISGTEEARLTPVLAKADLARVAAGMESEDSGGTKFFFSQGASSLSLVLCLSPYAHAGESLSLLERIGKRLRSEGIDFFGSLPLEHLRKKLIDFLNHDDARVRIKARALNRYLDRQGVPPAA